MIRRTTTQPPAGRAPPARTDVPAPPVLARVPAPTGRVLRPGEVLALQRTIGNRAVQRLLVTRASPRGAIQRDVGYEFETGWFVEQDKHDGKGFVPMPKGAIVGTGAHANFQVTADEAGGGRSEVEFVVHPPLPLTPPGAATVDGVMNGVATYAEGLRTAATGQLASFTLDAATGVPGDAGYRVHPTDAAMKAGPQVTAAIALGSVPRLADDNRGAPLPGGFRRTVATAGWTRADLDEGNFDETMLPLAFRPMNDKLKGLLMVLVSYLYYGDVVRNLEYVKQITDTLLLARTDLGSMFNMLPTAERDYYRQQGGHWVRLVMKAANLNDSSLRVIRHGLTDPTTMVHRDVGPTRSNWLVLISRGADLLAGDLEAEAESMGRLGGRTEPVGRRGEEAPIFEMRGAQIEKIPLSDWPGFARAVYAYLLDLNDPGWRDEHAREQHGRFVRSRYLGRLGIR